MHHESERPPPTQRLRRFKSAIETCLFPAVPEPQHAMLLSTLFQLEHSERAAPDAVRSRQAEQLDALWSHAVRDVPFYRDRAASTPAIAARKIGIDDWPMLPILSRVELQRHAGALQARKLPSGHARIGKAQTSGATGTPVVVATTSATRMMWLAMALRDHYWHGRDERGVLAMIRIFGDDIDAGYPRGVRRPDWGLPLNLVHDCGPAIGLSIHTDPPRQLEFLARAAPDYLLTFPSNAAALAELSAARGLRFDTLKEVRLMSEALDPAVSARIEAAWGARVTDTYSAQEVGYLALQCPERGAYHVQSENVFLEVVDDAGRACGPGQTGRVLVTALHNFATPLIRYEIGDYAKVGAPCGCGRGLPVLDRIFGRVRNMLVLPGGASRWPSLAGPFYREIAPVTQHQIVQHDLDRVEARLVVERELTRAEESALRAVILERLGHPFELGFTYPERIERSASGKFEEFISTVAAGRASGAGARTR